MPANRRPDPAEGVFETLLVLDGRPVEWEAHMERLHASLSALFPGRDRPALVARVPGGEQRAGASVLRIAVAPSAGGELTATIERRPAHGAFPVQWTGNSPALRGVTFSGGLGEHKWADRSFLDAAQTELPDGALPLIVDGDGTVLEASRANLFAVRGGALLTPPLDGRILPGVTRKRVLEIGGALGVEAREMPLRREDLQAAEEVFLTGSVRGIEPASSLDGTPLAGGGEIAARLAERLRSIWAGERTSPQFG